MCPGSIEVSRCGHRVTTGPGGEGRGALRRGGTNDAYDIADRNLEEHRGRGGRRGTARSPGRARANQNETTTLLQSKAARRSGLITGGFVFVLLYGVMARRRRLERIEAKLERIEAKLDAVIDEVADDREGVS